MKQIIFTAILIIAFCFAAFSQTSENLCPKINIKAPETVQPDESFKVFASFEKENQPSTSKFNWIVVKDNEVIKKNDAGIIEIDSKGFKDFGTILILAEPTDQRCQNTAAAKVFVVVNIGSPYIIDEYSKLGWSDERARLDNVVIVMQEFKDTEVFAFFDFDKRISQAERKNRLTKIANHLSIGGLEKNRITFLISEADTERIWYQLVPKKFSEQYFCDNCLVIKAENFEKLENLFKPKPITKNRKK
jgi:hypothetical protein